MKQKAQKAVRGIEEVAGATFSPGQREAIDKIVEELVIEAMRECEATYGHAARNCCSEDQDMSHKIGREIEQARDALIANLSALR
ncbi:hypothetical protein AAFN88_20610 [Pelagibius sp. CAU 1746]|uniref:hypothetical protein n=1 Tax=Pelagibius sp. CAU 1746 TaxID=3140370 RepID=UPI00325B71C6